MTTYNRGSNAVLSAEWRAYDGGPLSAVTGVTIAITPLSGGAPVIGPTATGVSTPATGVNAYTWAVSGAAAFGDYLVAWSGTDSGLDTVTATEVVTVGSDVAVPLAGPYITLAQLKSYMGIPDSNTAQDATLSARITGSSAGINRFCHRQFGRSEVITYRSFPVGRTGLDVDDFWDATDLSVTPYLGTIAGTAWDVSTLVLEPLNGIVDQVPGWPYRRLCWPYGWLGTGLLNLSGLSTALIGARWGWAAVPADVVTANLMLASMDVAAKGAPFGVAGFGDYAVRIRSNPMVEEKLLPYQIDTYQAAS